MHLLGIDIGGTKTAACVGTNDGEVLASQRISMSASDSIEDYCGRLEEACSLALSESGTNIESVQAIGISAPGPLDPRTGILISPPNNPGWHNVPIVTLVQKLFDKPVYLENDANAAALAEYWFGDYHGTQNMAYLTFSTGMGAGIIANGRLIQGANAMAGEIGHHTLDPNGPKCACGRFGCMEAYVGGRTVTERIRERVTTANISTSMLELAAGDPAKIDHRMFAQATRDGDAFAVAAWDEMIEHLAMGVGNLIMILNPELILLGTIAVHEGDLVMKPLMEKIRKYTWSWSLDACRIAPSTLGPRLANLAALAAALTGCVQEGSF
jgi:glucokinase